MDELSAGLNLNLQFFFLVQWWRKWIVMALRLLCTAHPRGGVILKVFLTQRFKARSE